MKITDYRPTDRRTDKPSSRDARMHLKIPLDIHQLIPGHEGELYLRIAGLTRILPRLSKNHPITSIKIKDNDEANHKTGAKYTVHVFNNWTNEQRDKINKLIILT